jgi:PHP family Zn ribbon phosphoesterase
MGYFNTNIGRLDAEVLKHNVDTIVAKVNCGRTKGWRKRTKDCPMCNTNDKVTTAKSYDWKCCPSCGRKFN